MNRVMLSSLRAALHLGAGSLRTAGRLALLLVAVPAGAQAEAPLLSHRLELGVAAGLFKAAANHELFDSPAVQQSPLSPLGLDLALRLGYFPLRFIGAELELGYVPERTAADKSAHLLAARAHGVLQLPWRLTPFVVIGGGSMGLFSGGDALGNDSDRAFHWGPGLKYGVSDRLSLRVDARHVVSGATGRGNTDHFELLLGASLALFELTAEPSAPLRVAQASPPPPPAPEPEPVVEPPQVEEVAAPAPAPAERVEMALARVHFAFGKAELQGADQSALDEVAELLQQHADLQVEIHGHTDSIGPVAFNRRLSERRAAAVKAYLVDRGVAAERLVCKGFGAELPIGSNKAARGRAKNRRSEFTVHGEPGQYNITPRDREN